MGVAGPVALVTGGARRVGRAIVLELARAGCDVAIHYRTSRTEAEEVAGEVSRTGRRALAIEADLSTPASWPQVIRQTVEGLGGLGILINNASLIATGAPDTIEGFSLASWERLLRLNLTAPMALAHHARPYLEKQEGGKIVNLCDISADRPWPTHLAYCVSKAALAALTVGLAKALAPRVRVNGIAPGIAVFSDDYPQERRAALISRIPLGRTGTPEDIARAVRFLVESGDYITGEIIRVDGGRSVV
ncbi:MAG: SDR family oxidoreductase [Planctomycetes bacterium]|nr:SDR family oxidoreductase [Planctomycetota bacterium]